MKPYSKPKLFSKFNSNFKIKQIPGEIVSFNKIRHIESPITISKFDNLEELDSDIDNLVMEKLGKQLENSKRKSKVGKNIFNFSPIEISTIKLIKKILTKSHQLIVYLSL